MLSSVGIQTGPVNYSSNRLLALKAPQRQNFPIRKNPSSSTQKKGLKPFTISGSLTQESSSILNDENQEKKKLGVVVKPMEKPRLALRFIWMEKNIGIAIDQVIPGGRGTIPVSPYYFWPKKDAWEELKVMLERKHWISYKQMVLLLNQASEIINLWQQSGGT